MSHRWLVGHRDDAKSTDEAHFFLASSELTSLCRSYDHSDCVTLATIAWLCVYDEWLILYTQNSNNPFLWFYSHLVGSNLWGVLIWGEFHSYQQKDNYLSSWSLYIFNRGDWSFVRQELRFIENTHRYLRNHSKFWEISLACAIDISRAAAY